VDHRDTRCSAPLSSSTTYVRNPGPPDVPYDTVSGKLTSWNPAIAYAPRPRPRWARLTALATWRPTWAPDRLKSSAPERPSPPTFTFTFTFMSPPPPPPPDAITPSS